MPLSVTPSYFVSDNRAQVQHHSTHHLSLFPRIVSTRGTYVLTSHVGKKLCAWDLRWVLSQCCAPPIARGPSITKSARPLK